jgi:hypothetical protein
MITHKWTIDKLQVAEDNIIVKVDWSVTATQDDLTASAAGTRNLTRGDSFIPYEQLTEQQVLDWCFEPETAMAEIDPTVKNLKQDVEAYLANQIAYQLNQKQLKVSLPWRAQESVA